MRGPYAQFSLDQVKLIHNWAVQAERRPDGEINAEMIAEIKDRCEQAIRWDPRLRQPDVQLTPKEIKDATMYGM